MQQKETLAISKQKEISRVGISLEPDYFSFKDLVEIVKDWKIKSCTTAKGDPSSF